MKNILITGGAGKIGLSLIEQLVKNKNINITVLDLKSTKKIYKLKPYRDKAEIIYGDINDQNLMKSLIKKHDCIIHLASVTPPLANIYDELCEYINLLGTEHICDLIKQYNPSCYLIYASSIIPADNKMIVDNYTKTNIKINDYIEKNVQNYTILHIQPVLFPKINVNINCGINDEVQFINIKSLINFFTKLIENSKNYNKKNIDICGNQKMIINYSDFIDRLKKINMLKYHRANNSNGYHTIVNNKDEFYQVGSLNDYFSECGKK